MSPILAKFPSWRSKCQAACLGGILQCSPGPGRVQEAAVKVWAYTSVLPKQPGRESWGPETARHKSPGLEGERMGREPFLEKQKGLTWSLLPAPGVRMGISSRESDPSSTRKRGLRSAPNVHGQHHLNLFLPHHPLCCLQTDCLIFPCTPLPAELLHPCVQTIPPLPILVRSSPLSRLSTHVTSPRRLAELVAPHLLIP